MGMAEANPQMGTPGAPVQGTVVQATVVQPAPQAQVMGQPMAGQPMQMPPKQVLERGFGDTPQPFVCQWCSRQGTTRVTHDTSMGTHLIALGICCIGCCPCCLIPYCADACKQANHY